MDPLVSVILNSYNQGRYLREAVESILAQTYRNIEVIAIDNGSTDGSQSILAEYADADARIKLLAYSENDAISRRFNEGVAASTGDFISFLYSDDRYLPSKTERQLELFAERDGSWGVVYGPALGYNELTDVTWRYGCVNKTGYIFESLLELAHRAGTIDMVTPLTRRQCFVEHPFHEDIFAEGEAIFYRIALTHRFTYINEPLVVLRDHGSNAGKALSRNLDMSLASLDHLRRGGLLDTRGHAVVDRYEAAQYRAAGWAGVRTDANPSWARNCLRQAVKRRLRYAVDPKVAIGYCLAILPRALRTRVNRLGHKIKNKPGNSTFVEKYEGIA